MTSAIASDHGKNSADQRLILDLPGDGARLAAAFAAAESRHGATVERWFHLGGAAVRMRFAGTALVGKVTRSFSHLAAPPRTSIDRIEHIERIALDVMIWDSHT